MDQILASLPNNPYFGAGFGLVGVGAALAIVRRLSQVGMQIGRRFYTVSLEVPGRDKSYQWLLQFITANVAKTSQHISVETTFEQAQQSGKVNTRFDYVPSPGIHFINYKNHWIRIERTREQQAMDFSVGAPFESVTLTTMGTASTKRLFEELLHESRRAALEKQEGKTPIYIAMGSEWRQFGFPRRKRPVESVILDAGIKESILADLHEFLATPEWYAERGIPYRRGYLLYGPPGCGKSSFIQSIAGHMDYGICILNLSERGLTDDRLNHLLNIAPQESIILLEDVDAAFVPPPPVYSANDSSSAAAANFAEEHPQMRMAYEGLSRLTFSGLLNALDGVASSEARVLFMTTNHVQRLDPALIRPGRVDFKQYVGHATPFQVRKMFERFYPETSSEVAEQFVAKLSDEKGKIAAVSLAQLQAHFMQYKKFLPDVIDKVDQIRAR